MFLMHKCTETFQCIIIDTKWNIQIFYYCLWAWYSKHRMHLLVCVIAVNVMHIFGYFRAFIAYLGICFPKPSWLTITYRFWLVRNPQNLHSIILFNGYSIAGHYRRLTCGMPWKNHSSDYIFVKVLSWKLSFYCCFLFWLIIGISFIY